jgi:hypothetical protein
MVDQINPRSRSKNRKQAPGDKNASQGVGLSLNSSSANNMYVSLQKNYKIQNKKVCLDKNISNGVASSLNRGTRGDGDDDRRSLGKRRTPERNFSLGISSVLTASVRTIRDVSVNSQPSYLSGR